MYRETFVVFSTFRDLFREMCNMKPRFFRAKTFFVSRYRPIEKILLKCWLLITNLCQYLIFKCSLNTQ